MRFGGLICNGKAYLCSGEKINYPFFFETTLKMNHCRFKGRDKMNQLIFMRAFVSS